MKKSLIYNDDIKNSSKKIAVRNLFFCSLKEQFSDANLFINIFT